MQKTRQAKINQEIREGLDVQTHQKRQMRALEILEMKQPMKTSMGPEETQEVADFK